MHRVVELGLVAVLAMAWLVVVSEPAERFPLRAGYLLPSGAKSPQSLNVTHFPVGLDWQPPELLCTAGVCLLHMPGNSSLEASFSHPGGLWNVNVTLTGTSLSGGQVPVVLLEAVSREPKCGVLVAEACVGGNNTREIGRWQGFPFHLDLRAMALAKGEIGLHLTVLGVPPSDATGLIQATPWHLEGDVEAVSPVPSG